MPKNILITGANGQVGKEFQSLVSNQEQLEDVNHFYFTTKEILDICDKESLKNFVKANKIDIIVNSAAYTAVDDAEKNSDLAFSVNERAVRNLAEISKMYDLKLIHISTDYVFDGTSHTPLTENDVTNPQGVYAQSKLAGEEAIFAIKPIGASIIRTSWVYSANGSNFVKTMLRVGSERDEINVVCDQIGTPTYARDLARTILIMVDKVENHEEVHIYHYSNEGNCSWYDFAQAIFEIAQIDCKVNPINTQDYPTPAKRPSYSVLSKDKIKHAYNLKIPYWRDSLKSCIALLDIKEVKCFKIGIIGSGFIGGGLAKLLMQHPSYELGYVLTRTPLSTRDDFISPDKLTNSLDLLIDNSDLIVECSGDAIYATETIDRILKSDIPVVTMNSEFHVTTGSYFVDKGLVTEAEGDQPGVQAILHEEALAMGFKPLVYANIKGFLNENPTKEDMEYWGSRSNLSLEMVTSFTDGTKVEIEQVLVANGLGAGLIKEGLVKLENDNMLEGGTILAKQAKELGYPVSDYLLSSTLPAGVFLIVEHDEDQQDSLRYYKLGDGPFYVLERTYHLCHLEIIKTIKRVLNGGGVLLNNGAHPKFSVASIAKRDLKPGDQIKKGIGSFDVRGIAIDLSNDLNHVPIGLLADAVLIKEIKEGEKIHFDDVELPESLALNIWKKILNKSVVNSVSVSNLL